MEGEWGAGLAGEDWDSILETETAPIAGSSFSQSFLEGSASGSGGSNVSCPQPSANKVPSREASKGLPCMGTGTSSASATGASAAAPTSWRPIIQQPLRKSCEFCRLRKKKCDGDGLNRCSLCVSRGLERCVYTERISSAPKNPARSAKRSKTKQGLGQGKDAPPPSSSRLSTGSIPETSRGGDSELVPMKRCRLSASPATGLVGMQENVFLSDYFECMGLLPLTSEKDVRQAMVSVMLAALSPDQRDRHARVRPRPTLGIPKEAGPERGMVSSGVSSRVNAQALTCALWCAVALGALIRGWPTSSVTRYVELARDSLTRCFDEASVDTLRAYVLMAFLHNFLGEERKFQKYLMFAHGIARALPLEDVPREVLDLLSVADSAALFSGVAPTVDELEAFCRPAEGEMKVQAPTASRKLDFCRFLLQADHRHDQAFYKDMVAQGVLGRTKGPAFSSEYPQNPQQQQQVEADWVDDDEEGHDGGGNRFGDRGSRDSVESVLRGRPHGGGVGQGVEGDRKMREGLSGRRVPGGSCGSEVRLTLHVEGGADCEPPPPGEITFNTVMEEMAVMRGLEQEGKWPDTQNGIGGFLYNTRLAFQAFMVQERPFGFKALNGTMKVLLQNPGLLRFSSWLHMMHCVLALFAELETGERYTKLRDLYNRMKPAGFNLAPPFEEFRGMNDICQHIFCRSCLSKQWVKDDDTIRFYADRPKAPGAASAETANLPPAVSCSEGAPPASVWSSSSYGGQPGAAPAEPSVAAATATVTGQIGVPRVVVDDNPQESGPVHTSNRGTQTQRVDDGGSHSKDIPPGQQRAWSSSDGDGGGGGPVHKMPEDSVLSRSTATAEEDEARRERTREDHRPGSGLDTHLAAGPHPSMPPIADTREGLVAGALGSGSNDYGGPVSFDTPGCLLLEEALLGDESAEEEMWALGADAMGFDPSYS